MNEEIAFLISYLKKQLSIINKIQTQLEDLDLEKYENRYVLALKTQHLYTAIEDIFKQVARVFENHIEDPSRYHRELIERMNIEIMGIRPSVISDDTMSFLDRLRRFRHFVRHAYNFEFDTDELVILQGKIKDKIPLFQNDMLVFQTFLDQLLSGD